MTDNAARMITIGLIALALAIVFGRGFHDLAAVEGRSVYVLNRVTGDVKYCEFDECSLEKSIPDL